MNRLALLLCLPFAFAIGQNVQRPEAPHETPSAYEARMRWWAEARFGLFIHWGLYAIPAGEWNGRTDHAEWIRTTAQIPLQTYDSLVGRFNPQKFDAGAWVRLAREAGMKYVTITTKHHDGFCLFDSRFTTFDAASTPFGRDVMKELSDACRREGMRICWYHSIMDWHHPDYLPRRTWETDRPVAGADFDRYVVYLKNQVRELLTRYGTIGVLWFDGEWESTWNADRGRDLESYVRSLQPDIIVNDRVAPERSGMEVSPADREGDFATPEQSVPHEGISGAYWETCMTMNDHWGYNSHDTHWKSAAELIRTLEDVASKGGNFLLNVGPTANGEFPPEAVDRLHAIGKWMSVNGEAIYSTQAGALRHLGWGRSTQKSIAMGTRLYLHVFQWPSDGRLIVAGLYNQPTQAYLLNNPGQLLPVSRKEAALLIQLPAQAPDTGSSVVVLDVTGSPDVDDPPEIASDERIFVDTLGVAITSSRKNVELRYTTEGTAPTMQSPRVDGPLRLDRSATVSARCFRDGVAVSGNAEVTFTKVEPRQGTEKGSAMPGLRWRFFPGDWDSLPSFDALHAAQEADVPDFTLKRPQPEFFGCEYSGLIEIRTTGVYRFSLVSDDGSRLYIDQIPVVDNDGLHGMREAHGSLALAKGFHAIRVCYFQKGGDAGLDVEFAGPGMKKGVIPSSILSHR